MQRPALDFGNSGVVRFYCDACGKPLGLRPDGTAMLVYQGDAGEYCSKTCLRRCDPERLKVKIPEPPKVKISEAHTVTTPEPPKVKIARLASPHVKVKKQGREQRRIERRAAIQRIRREILKSAGREPTIAEVQQRLAALVLTASVRTIWKDLTAMRAEAGKGIANGRA